MDIFNIGAQVLKLGMETVELIEAQLNGATGEEKKSEALDVMDVSFDILADRLGIHPDLRNPIKETFPAIIDKSIDIINKIKPVLEKSIF